VVGQDKKQAKCNAILEQASLLEYSQEFENAAALYRKAAKVYPQSDKAWFKYGQMLSKLGKNESEQKLAYLNTVAIDSNSKNAMQAYGALATLYKNQSQFDSAAWAFSNYYNHKNLPEKRKSRLANQLSQIEYAAKLYKNPIKIYPKPLPETVNTPTALQYFPILTGDGSQMLFTQRNKGSQNEDLYMSIKNGTWQTPIKLPASINSNEAEGTATMSADGRMIICSYCAHNRENFGKCDLYFSTYDGKNWSQLKNLGASINSEYYESQPSLSSDGKTLYFVSDRPNGIGGLDIYISQYDSQNWSNAINAGAKINTKDNDGSPFIHSNGSSLFFASKGHLGLGGYDLFLIEKEDGIWQEAQNLGYPINDQKNQVSLYVSPDGGKGYFSQEEFEMGKPMANQSRIWTFDVPPELKLGHRSNAVTGIVYNNLTKQPIEASLKLIDLETGVTKGQVNSGVLDGKYLVMLNEGSEYAFYAETPGYLFKSIHFDYSEKEHLEPIKLDIYLDPIVKGVTVQLNNIYFETGKSKLLSKSKVELEKLYQLMKKNPTLKIELGGHTDNVGSEAINQTLSQKRVNAVKTYLVNRGIASNRMVGKGYGESKPVADNGTTAGRKQNRRVEFTVL
jgi:outer membrane protein OmpA-like peptidoglycan-associated protein